MQVGAPVDSKLLTHCTMVQLCHNLLRSSQAANRNPEAPREWALVCFHTSNPETSPAGAQHQGPAVQHGQGHLCHPVGVQVGAQRDPPAEPGGGAVLAGALPAHGPLRLLLLQEVRLQVAGLPLWEGLAQVRRLRPLTAAPLLLVEQGEGGAAKNGFSSRF
jgi:hypothetical protein